MPIEQSAHRKQTVGFTVQPFPLFLIMLTVLCAVTVVALWLHVYDTVSDYEKSQPSGVLRQIEAMFEQKNYAALLEHSDLILSPYEDLSALEQRMQELTGGTTSDVQIVQCDETHYDVLGGRNTLATVVLRHIPSDKDDGFGTWENERLTLAISPRTNLIVDCPDGVTVWVNGKPSKDAEKAEKATDTAYGTLPAQVPQAVFMRYFITGLLCKPEITAEDAAGRPCRIEQTGDMIRVVREPDEALTQRLSSLAIAASQMYARYITKDAERTDVLPFFLEGTEIHSHIQNFYSGWYNDHDAYSFSNAQISKISMLDDMHISCDITFDYTIKMGRHTFDYPSHYTLYFVKLNAGWKISNLLVR